METKVNLKHYLFQGRGSEGSLPIYLRITVNRKKAEIHSGYYCTIKDWNPSGQQTKSKATVNKELLDQKGKILDFKIELEKNNKPVSATILKELYTGKSTVQSHLLDYLVQYIEELKIKNEIKLISLNKYEQSKKTLSKFISEKYALSDVTIDKVTYEFINAYGLFLKQEYDLHKNTINKYHTRLKTILLRAQAEGIITKQPYSNFKLVTAKTERTFLNSEDLNKIVKVDLSHNGSLDRVRDLFIFSCYTGLRFQDAQNLTTENLSKNKNKFVLVLSQQKTDATVQIPLFDIAKSIIDKYKESNERKVLKRLLPKISNQKVNSYLKIVGDLAGISQPITHHMARHTFATTVCLNNHMPIEDLSKLLGHSSIKTTSIYGRITQQRLTESINRVEKKLRV
ncbi:MAG: site-specific integrase [Chitinophagales bacterium]